MTAANTSPERGISVCFHKNSVAGRLETYVCDRSRNELIGVSPDVRSTGRPSRQTSTAQSLRQEHTITSCKIRSSSTAAPCIVTPGSQVIVEAKDEPEAVTRSKITDQILSHRHRSCQKKPKNLPDIYLDLNSER
jgi:hypothetical protein